MTNQTKLISVLLISYSVIIAGLAMASKSNIPTNSKTTTLSEVTIKANVMPYTEIEALPVTINPAPIAKHSKQSSPAKSIRQLQMEGPLPGECRHCAPAIPEHTIRYTLLEQGGPGVVARID